MRSALAREGRADKAVQMQRYMKSTMPYHGVPMPRVRLLARELLGTVTFSSARDYAAWVRALWHGATHREERYVALALVGFKASWPFQTLEAIPLYEELIVDGAWWDFVDDVAVHRLGPLYEVDAEAMAKHMRAWAASDDLWKRRSAIISQLQRKGDTDLKLLFDCIEPAMSSKEFFLRKAIGWALRELSKTMPEVVERYVRVNEARLSGLSKREALRLLD